MKSEKICPICGKSYTGEPALSRKDNATLICPDCGIMEALASLGRVRRVVLTVNQIFTAGRVVASSSRVRRSSGVTSSSFCRASS